MPDVTITQVGIPDILEQLRYQDSAVRMVREAYRSGLNFSRYLEKINPTETGDPLDAFERLMLEAGIITRSDPQSGYWASEAEDFFKKPEGRALYPEFFARQWRKVSFARKQQRAITLNDGVPGSWERPYSEAQSGRWDTQIAPAIPLSELVAMVTPVEGDLFRSFYLETDAAAERMFRVGESANIPITTIEDHQNTIDLHKYGRGLQSTYEQMRRIRIDKLALLIQRVAIRSEVDKVAAALDVLVSGDGNANTAATVHNLTTLDAAATAGTLTLKGWLAFKMKFVNPYMITHVLGTEASILQLILLDSGFVNVPLFGLSFAGLTPQNLTPINATADGVRYGWTADAPALKLVGFDGRMALEMLTEIGGTIAETERFITNQTEIMVMTEVMGFAILDQNGTEILDINA